MSEWKTLESKTETIAVPFTERTIEVCQSTFFAPLRTCFSGNNQADVQHNR